MLKISDILSDVPLNRIRQREAVAKALGIPAHSVKDVSIYRQSVDARKRTDVHYVYTLLAAVDNEDRLSLLSLNNVSLYEETLYQFPFNGVSSSIVPVIVGAGPAGLFCALAMAEAGIPPILIERGMPVEKRLNDVELFWKSGALNLESNVQFGEGGAGTFSDGKLTTGVNDRRIPYFLRQLVRFGAPEDILYLSHPHVGTDRLIGVMSSLREHLVSLGCDIRFGHRLTGLDAQDGKLTRARFSGESGDYSIDTSHLIIAPGNGARDTFEMLSDSGVTMSAKNFAVGFRIEHLQKTIDTSQYGSTGIFPPSSYKLVSHKPGGRSVYSFCVCPGGQVIASASEPGRLVTNGMSRYERDGANINGALLVGVSSADFPEGPLGGIEFQRMLESAAFEAGGGNYNAPVQLVGDFLNKKASAKLGSVKPTYLPGVKPSNMWDFMPQFICESIASALPEFDRKIRGFADPSAVLTAVETRSSSPLRIERGDDFSSISIKGLYPCGEGAGYAGGITSSAVDGIKCAEAVLSSMPLNR